MRIYRSIFLSTLRIALLTTGISAFAQWDPGQWVGDLYLIHRRTEFPMSNALIDENNSIHLTIPSIAKATDLPVPQNRHAMMVWSLWHDNSLYTAAFGNAKTNEKNEDGTEFKRWAFAKWEDGNWHYLGEYKSYEPGNLLIAIPCNNARFIVISSKKDITGNNNDSTSSPYCRMSIISGKKEIRLDASIDHGMGELRKHMSNPICFGLAADSRIVMTDRHATLINYETGLYWIFSLEKASLTRTGNIFKKITTEMIVNGGFSNAILCANPEKDGTVLISAQEEAAFMTETGDALKELNEIFEKNPDLSMEDAKKLLLLRQKELADKNPLMVWYRIYPESGKVEKLGLPPIGGAFVREGTKNDVWRPMPNGSVQMGALEPLLKENKLKQQQKGAKPSDK